MSAADIDRLSKALDEGWTAWWKEHPGDAWEDVPDSVLVRAVLTALREPSEGMVEAGQSSGPNGRLWDDDVISSWQAMIDKLLEE